MRKKDNRFRVQLKSSLESMQLFLTVCLIVLFIVKGSIDLFTTGHHFFLNYLWFTLSGCALYFIGDVILMGGYNHFKQKNRHNKGL